MTSYRDEQDEANRDASFDAMMDDYEAWEALPLCESCGVTVTDPKLCEICDRIWPEADTNYCAQHVITCNDCGASVCTGMHSTRGTCDECRTDTANDAGSDDEFRLMLERISRPEP